MIKIGDWVFDEFENGDGEKMIRCRSCKRDLKRKTLESHVLTHDRREEQRLNTIAKRELGMRKIKVLKGQGSLF